MTYCWCATSWSLNSPTKTFTKKVELNVKVHTEGKRKASANDTLGALLAA